jgi:hypothetical protein
MCLFVAIGGIMNTRKEGMKRISMVSETSLDLDNKAWSLLLLGTLTLQVIVKNGKCLGAYKI